MLSGAAATRAVEARRRSTATTSSNQAGALLAGCSPPSGGSDLARPICRMDGDAQRLFRPADNTRPGSPCSRHPVSHGRPSIMPSHDDVFVAASGGTASMPSRRSTMTATAGSRGASSGSGRMVRRRRRREVRSGRSAARHGPRGASAGREPSRARRASLVHSRGVVLSDGRALPLWDWIVEPLA